MEEISVDDISAEYISVKDISEEDTSVEDLLDILVKDIYNVDDVFVDIFH